MRRFLLAAVAVLPLMLAGCGAPDRGDAQTLVDRATLSVQDMMNQTVSDDPQRALRNARAVMICPRLFKASFFFGGEGGFCVLLTRSGNGTWSYPAFYSLGSGSFGFQFGVEDSSLMMMIMTQRGLNAVLDNQFKLGAGASIAVATVGASVQGATTTAVGADIVAFAYSRGLFGGVALDGGIMSTRTDYDQQYYGQPMAARQIVTAMQGVNPGADPLREVLTRFGSRAAFVPPGPPRGGPPPGPPPGAGPGNGPAFPPSGGPAGYQGPPASYQPPPGYAPPSSEPPGGAGPIQQQSLAPPRG
jgi:lipid-binding SYLF domain-containing protein